MKHPARYSTELMPVLAGALEGYPKVLDPFAGTGRIHELMGVVPDIETYGIEIEPEWAAMTARTEVGNALALPFEDDFFDAACTSPTYGNRHADHHNANDPSTRHSYTHDLGHALQPDNSGVMHWGGGYRHFHRQAWAEVNRVLRPGGRFVLNISDHIRRGDRQPVTAWHIDTIMRGSGPFELTDVIVVKTRRNRFGENADARVDNEFVVVFDKANLK